MSYDKALMLTLIAIMCAGYILSSALLYFFGWYSDKRLRMVLKKIKIYPFERFFLHFRGASKSKTLSFTALCVICERAAFILLGAIPVSLIAAKLTKNIVTAGRISLAVLALSVIAVIVLSVYSGRALKKKSALLNKAVKREDFNSLDGVSSGIETFVPKEKEAVKTAAVTDRKAEMMKNTEKVSANGGFYRPVADDDKLESFESARKRQQETDNKKDGEVQSSEEIRSAISSFKQINPIADENIIITNYSQVSEKYRDVKITGDFAGENSLEQGREILRRKKESLSAEAETARNNGENSDLEILRRMKENRDSGKIITPKSGSSDLEILKQMKEKNQDSGKRITPKEGPSDLEMLKVIKERQRDDSEVGSLKDMIEKNKNNRT